MLFLTPIMTFYIHNVFHIITLNIIVLFKNIYNKLILSIIFVMSFLLLNLIVFNIIDSRNIMLLFFKLAIFPFHLSIYYLVVFDFRKCFAFEPSTPHIFKNPNIHLTGTKTENNINMYVVIAMSYNSILYCKHNKYSTCSGK